MTEPKIRVAHHELRPAAAVVPLLWFESAFSVAYGNTIREALGRVYADVVLIQAALASDDAAEAHKALENLRCRLSVGVEWGERVEEAERLTQAFAKDGAS